MNVDKNFVKEKNNYEKLMKSQNSKQCFGKYKFNKLIF